MVSWECHNSSAEAECLEDYFYFSLQMCFWALSWSIMHRYIELERWVTSRALNDFLRKTLPYCCAVHRYKQFPVQTTLAIMICNNIVSHSNRRLRSLTRIFNSNFSSCILQSVITEEIYSLQLGKIFTIAFLLLQVVCSCWAATLTAPTPFIRIFTSRLCSKFLLCKYFICVYLRALF